MSPKQAAQRPTRTRGRGWTGPMVLSPAGLAVRARSLLLSVPLIVATLVVGWLAWSVVEWRRGRTPGYRLTGLVVVRHSDGGPIGLGRSVLRELCCLLLLLPTLVVCGLLAIAFVMGASPPDGLSTQPRRAPWDVLTATEVMREVTRHGVLGEFTPDGDLAQRRN
jgi:RDD family protein